MATLVGSGIVAYRQVLWNTKSWAETSFTIQKRLLYQEFLFTYGLKSGSYAEKRKRTNRRKMQFVRFGSPSGT